MSANRSVSVRQLASQLGVSVATVSRALNNHPEVAPETRSRVLQAADDAGYMPPIGRRMTTAIGLVYPAHPVRADYGSFESAMLAGILRGVAEQRYDVTIIDLERDKADDETYVQFFRRKGVRGVIVRSISPTPVLAELIADEGFPSVLIADRSDHPNVNFIRSDSRADSTRAVEHLVHLGHQRIALGVHAVFDSDHRDRYEGFLEGMERFGLDPDPELIVRSKAFGSMEGGAAMVSRLLSMKHPPTAIYFTNPLSTVGALHRCLELGIRVPRDLSIVGFDDSDVRFRTFPRCTAIVQDASQLGVEASRWLTRSLAGVSSGRLRSHNPTMFSVNESTGPVPERPVRLTPGAGVVVRE